MKIVNAPEVPVGDIVGQMMESRPLPMGRKEFEEWSDRIIAGALIPAKDEDPDMLIKSQKFVLADMIMHLGPTESHKPDAHFIHSLRKVAINQVAHAMKLENQTIVKSHLSAKEKAKAMDETPKG